MKTLLYPAFALLLIALASCSAESNSENDQPDSENDADTQTTGETADTSNTTELVEPSIIYGIDISKWQGDEMSLLTKENDSLNFVICRSTEGITYTDPTFANNWKLCKEKGFIRGAYHFYRSDDDPSAQVDNFLNAIKGMEDSDLPPIIDFEEESIASGSDKETVIEDLWKFIFLLEQKTGRTPIIYTDENIGNSYLTAARFANYPLWIADYNPGTEPRMPGAWKGMKWVLWQKTDKYMFENIQDDFDSFNGSMDDLKSFISGSILN